MVSNIKFNAVQHLEGGAARSRCDAFEIVNEHGDKIRISKDGVSNAIIISADGALVLTLQGGNRLSLTAVGVNE